MLVWLSLDTWLISLLSISYLLLLFVVAYWGQKETSKKWLSRPWIYSLSLGVSCTSWAFYGTVGQAATTGAWLAPVYIGTILSFVLAWPMLLRILRITKQQNLTSIADFIACRYDRSPAIAATVTLVALLGTIPYIALQLRAISKSFDLLTGSYQSGISTTFIMTLVLIIFSILFGARQAAINKQSQGLVLAIAFSSVIKLFALTAVGIFATFFVFDGVADLFAQSQHVVDSQPTSNSYFAISQAILGMITIFILPQQYHMMMIENHQENELKSARYLYPLYLIAINIFVLPIALAGQNLFPGGNVNADTYVITIPLFFQQAWLGGLAYIGGLAAATSMVIVATIVLSTMVTTEIVTPLLLHYNSFVSKQKTQLSHMLLNIRRVAIALLLLLAFTFERIINQQNHLATIGLLSFVLLSQLAPLVIGALYWRKATKKAALAGLTVGSIIWLYTLLLPSLLTESLWLNTGIFGINWLKPYALFGFNSLDHISHGLLFSLLANSLCFIIISLLSHRSVSEKLQTELFVYKQQGAFEQNLSSKDLYHLLQRFINNHAAETFLHDYAKQLTSTKASEKLIDYTRLQLSSVLGSASTRMVMKAVTTQQTMPLQDVVNIVDEANKLFHFNRELLHAGVENIEQGISVIDADMRIVAWNKRYIELLGYPAEIVKVGKPVAELISFNAERGIIITRKNNVNTKENEDDFISRRIEHMRQGNSHHFQREMPSGIVLEIRGQAMPGGGFVSTFSDITSHIEATKALQQANENLEQRVTERTIELTKAKAEAEAANTSKSKFLAAASHDLMQPFNALSLFTNMLNKKVQGSDLAELATNIQYSLSAAESLLADLVEISRLDNSSQKIDIHCFSINDLLEPLGKEFSLMSQQAGLQFNYVKSTCIVETDQRLLRRIVQNFLSNALNYCPQKNSQGKVLLGVKHQKNKLVIEVWDNGPGIGLADQQTIFKEFERLKQTQDKSGLGLGLAICERIAKLLNVDIAVKSTLGKGTCFSVTLPRSTVKLTPMPAVETSTQNKTASEFIDLPILLVDNEAIMLKAIQSQLQEWGCKVLAVKDEKNLTTSLTKQDFIPTIIISDYHLDNDENGVDLIQRTLSKQAWQVPCIICSADPSEQVREHTNSAQFYFMRKPIKALALKKLMKQLLMS
ncbi:PAS domain-containing hybrid sensor histidine kinase/response regulator [Candidatus Colwellia aromaticivorans]|uniref:PAS domain-containing hybrid sensor histidine kinase/response regulator n=1 Tax=Candidatus Colwellia aromaticivorans TaxID=2267621 RepID=UPI000DF45150|nr:PAS-domain containing protein [Candidatus Colwellia aromaticivorans]